VESLARISTLALDSAPLIYYIEEEPRYLPLLVPLIDAIDAGKITCYASTIVLLEVLVKPLREKDEALAHEIEYCHCLGSQSRCSVDERTRMEAR
jgi:hypothetical protein